MPHSAIVVFTGRKLEEILRPDAQGSGDWRLDPARARQAEFLVCTRNRRSADFPAAAEPHRSAFLIGRIADVVRSPDRPDRWLIRISEYIACNTPNIWAKSGHLRYPVWYTTLEDLGIDLANLPPFQPLPNAPGLHGVREIAAAPVIAPAGWAPAAGGQDSWRRLDAILDQIDRIPDLPTPFDPLAWDEHGLPR